jgi:hypothetical protein
MSPGAYHLKIDSSETKKAIGRLQDLGGKAGDERGLL